MNEITFEEAKAICAKYGLVGEKIEDTLGLIVNCKAANPDIPPWREQETCGCSLCVMLEVNRLKLQFNKP